MQVGSKGQVKFPARRVLGLVKIVVKWRIRKAGVGLIVLDSVSG